ncbi:TrbI/VirB10 family protein [Megalodesulfovibrio paquesii]
MQPDDNPNHLAPQTGAGQGQIALRKAPLAVVLVVGLGLLGVLAYSIHKESSRTAAPAAPIKAEPEKPFLPPAAGSGLVAPKKPEPARATPDANQTTPQPLITVVPVQTDKRAEALRREQDQLRQQRRKLQQTALASPLKAIKGKEADPAADAKPQERPQRVAAQAGQLGGTGLTGQTGQMLKTGQEHDEFQADSGKEAFLRRNAADDWSLGHARTPGAALELKTGGVIPALLLTGINSELPGVLIAQVGQNVFDTASGRHLLIPQGAKLYGVYDSRVVYGQSRVLVAWNRIIFPDGSALTLGSKEGAMPGADTAGYAGFTDQVETHFWRTFGTAALMSLVSGASSYALEQFGAGGDSDNPSMQDQLGTALASQLGQTTAKLLEKNLSVKPTLQIRPGYRFNIVVTKDLVFEEPYAPWQ